MRLLWAASIVLVAGCATDTSLEEVPVTGGSDIQNISFMTTRMPDAGGALIGCERAADEFYGLIEVGIPETHRQGQVETSSGVPDLCKHFVNTGVTMMERDDDFVAEISDQE